MDPSWVSGISPPFVGWRQLGTLRLGQLFQGGQLEAVGRLRTPGRVKGAWFTQVSEVAVTIYPTGWGPQDSLQLVQISGLTLVYGRYNELVNAGYIGL